MTSTPIDVWVCTDCYFAHHYGATEATVYPDGTSVVPTIDPLPIGASNRWFAGESDMPADREPLALLPGPMSVADNTCSNHRYGQDDELTEDGEYVNPCDSCGSTDDDDGEDTFSWRHCQGCGSNLGGARYRLAVWESDDSQTVPENVPFSGSVFES